jgi:hypothetical protein
MAKKRGKNRRPTRGVNIGGGPIAGLLVAKLITYAAPETIRFQIGIAGVNATFTAVGPAEQISEINPAWVKCSELGVDLPVTAGVFKTNGDLEFTVPNMIMVLDWSLITINSNVKMLEQFQGMIFCGAVAKVPLTAM